MARYMKAPPEVAELVALSLDKHHPDLDEAKVKIGALFAYGHRNEETGEIEKPAISVAGVAVQGTVKIHSQRDRVSGLPDASVILDGDVFPAMDEEAQLALVDDCLEWLQVMRDDEGAVKSDDCGRPRLKKKAPDLLVCGFLAVVQRHGRDAPEAGQLVAAGKMVQGVFKWE